MYTYYIYTPVLIPKEGIAFFLDFIPLLTKSLSVNLEKVRVIIFLPSFFFNLKHLVKFITLCHCSRQKLTSSLNIHKYQSMMFDLRPYF